MNIINRFYLGVAMLPSPLYKSMGVNMPQLKAILKAKLTMDDRKPVSFGGRKQRDQKKEVSGSSFFTFLFALIFGGLFGMILFTDGSPLIVMTIYLTVVLVMLASSLIAEFSSILFDLRDNTTLLPKPINDATFTVARIVHIGTHLLKLLFPMSLPGVIIKAYKSGILPALSLLVIMVLLALTAVFLVISVYLIIMKLVKPEKFKSVLGGIQIAFTVLIFGGYQLLFRNLDWTNLENFDLTHMPWLAGIPTFWLANSFAAVAGEPYSITMALLGIVGPVVAIVLVVKLLAPSFTKRIGGMQGVETTSPVKKPGRASGNNSYGAWLSSLFNSTAPAKGSFMFAWRMMMRSREFKIKVYPGAGYLLVYGFIMFSQEGGMGRDIFSTGGEKLFSVALLYLSGFMLNMATRQLNFSEKYKAAFIFYSSPQTQPGIVIWGAFKAAVAMFFLPFFLIATIASLAIGGPSAIPHLLLALSNIILVNLVSTLVQHRMFPFSLLEAMASKSGSFLRSILSILLFTIMGIAHYMLFEMKWVILMGIILSLGANWLMISTLVKTSLQQIRIAYDDN